MKLNKMFIMVIVFSILLFLSACDYNGLDPLNEQIETIEIEEDGYIFFTIDSYINGDDQYNFKELTAAMFEQEQIEYEFIVFSYTLSDHLVYALINYAWDEDEKLKQAIAIYDFIDDTFIYFEQLPLTSTMYDRQYIIGADMPGIMWLYDEFHQALVLYEYINDEIIVRKIQFEQFEESHTVMNDNGVFTRFQTDPAQFTVNVIDSYDYINDIWVETSLDFEELGILQPDFIQVGDHMYQVEITEKLTITDEHHDIYFESDLVTIYQTSKDGMMIENILTDLNMDDEPTYLNLFVSQNNIYLIVQYERGLFMNKSLLGKSHDIIFRFDVETQTLKYIGYVDSLCDVYKN